MVREVVLDTETTGLDASCDRLIEIGCVELINRIPTRREFHCYLNPERTVHPEALAIHGLSNEFLRDKRLFKDVVDELLAFVADAPLVIHNASFDIGFINTELERLGKPGIASDRLIDTLLLARRKHPAGPNNLDALCKRYGIDNSKRNKHGALTDSLLLAQVYVELLGERQASLGLSNGEHSQTLAPARRTLQRPAPLARRLTLEAENAHRAFIDSLGQHAIWHRYLTAR
jgi:DNA polymerase-3 subunit epsilon